LLLCVHGVLMWNPLVRHLSLFVLCPHWFNEQFAEDIIATILAEAKTHDDSAILIPVVLARYGAYRHGRILKSEEMQKLIETLERCPNPQVSPDERPTLVHISADQLATEFANVSSKLNVGLPTLPLERAPFPHATTIRYCVPSSRRRATLTRQRTWWVCPSLGMSASGRVKDVLVVTSDQRTSLVVS
jgi:hypothetical protein